MGHPILKSQRSSSDPFPFSSHPALESPHVHFPPTPILTSTYSADSPNTYDRAPIDVAPNLCALPERGDRVLTSRRYGKVQRDYFHPRAFEACERETVDRAIDPLRTPPLIPDLSSASESDESDGFTSFASELVYPPSVPLLFTHDTPQLLPIPRTHSQEELHTALSFLPYPPSSKDGSRHGRSPNRPRARELGQRCPKSVSAFATLSLDDGCLGGF